MLALEEGEQNLSSKCLCILWYCLALNKLGTVDYWSGLVDYHLPVDLEFNKGVIRFLNIKGPQ